RKASLSSLPLVGVSACLLGQSVRYDGRDKYTALICDELKQYCRLLAVCPEVEIGLGVPRAKIQLTQVGTSIKVLQMPELRRDVSADLQNFAIEFIKQHDLSALVLQDKSPSCGVGNTKLYSPSGEEIGLSSGLFAATIMEVFPDIQIVQASQLQTSEDIVQFVKKLETK
ncbi:MAG: DUF523 domain-containing protein, partial [Methylococcales bacterium]